MQLQEKQAFILKRSDAKPSEIPIRIKGPQTPQTFIATLEEFRPQHNLQGRIKRYSLLTNQLSNEQLIEEIIKVRSQKHKASWMQQELLYRVLPMIVSAVSRYLKSLTMKTGKEMQRELKTDYYNEALKAVLEALENRARGTCVLGNHREYTFDKIKNAAAFVYKTARFSCFTTERKLTDIQIKSETKEYFSYIDYDNENIQSIIEYTYTINTLNDELPNIKKTKTQNKAEEFLCFAMNPSNKVLSERQATALKKKYWDNDSSNTKYKNSEAMARAEGMRNLKKFFTRVFGENRQTMGLAVGD